MRIIQSSTPLFIFFQEALTKNTDNILKLSSSFPRLELDCAIKNDLYRALSELFDRDTYLEIFSDERYNELIINYAHHFISIGHNFYDDVYKQVEASKNLLRDNPPRNSMYMHNVLRLLDPKSSLYRSCHGLLSLFDASIIVDSSPAFADKSINEDEKFVLCRVYEEFDFDFYNQTYRLNFASAEDAIYDYCESGWKKLRNPNASFDTAYYLRENNDVREAEINPFYHYIVAGRQEGRTAKAIKSSEVDLLSNIKHLRDLRTFRSTYDKPLIDYSQMLELVTNLTKHNSYVVSVTHDCYINHTGGVQIFLCDEQRLLNEQGISYIAISPVEPRQIILKGHLDYEINLIIDGTLLGHISISSFFQALNDTDTSPVYWLIHTLLGHKISLLKEYMTLQPAKTMLWLHDYETMCSGYTLLRNELEYCGAPPPNSLACRFVCMVQTDHCI